MQDMTWPEIARAQRDRADTVIIVATAWEQHGPHLPAGTDAYWGTELARRVARALGGRALVGPVIPFGPNEEMMSFPGTVSLRKETLLAVLRDVCESYARHGFRHLVLLSSHEGDYAALSQVTRDLQDVDANLIVFDDLNALMGAVQGAARAGGVNIRVAGAHSGEFETSLMLAAYPDKVHMDRAEQGYMLDLTEQPDFFRQDLRRVTPNGIIGDARGATAEQGERYWQALTNLIAQYVESRWNN